MLLVQPLAVSLLTALLLARANAEEAKPDAAPSSAALAKRGPGHAARAERGAGQGRADAAATAGTGIGFQRD